MRKIPTVFQRDPDNLARVRATVHPDCLWVAMGEGIATEKFDGTCVLYEADGTWWARREVKPGQTTPDQFRLADTDPVTGKNVGWMPADQSSFRKYLQQAAEGCTFTPGTYELCGPKINGNRHGFDSHLLIAHRHARVFLDVPRDFIGLREWMGTHLAPANREGLVFHHQDGRMAKIKCRDFGLGD